jgi:hypothetical protein
MFDLLSGPPMNHEDSPRNNSDEPQDSNGDGEENRIDPSQAAAPDRQASPSDTGNLHHRPKPSKLVRFWHALWRKRIFIHHDPNSPNWAEKSSMVITGGIFLAALVQAGIYWKQADIMQDSLNQNERQIILGQGQLAVAARNAKTAEESLKSSDESFHIDHRPYVFVGTNRQERPPIEWEKMSLFPAVDISLKNFGHSPAVAFKIGCQVVFGNNALGQVRYVPTEKKIGEAFIAPGDAMLHSCVSTDKISSEGDVRVVYGTNYFLVVFGHVEYSDLWNTQPPYSTEFCYVRLANGLSANCPPHHLHVK